VREMIKKTIILVFVLFFPLFALTSSKAWGVPFLSDWAFNDNGSVYTPYDTDPADLPNYYSTGGFDWDTGLGTLSVAFDSSNTYSFIAFFDHEIVQAGNTYFDEFGEVHGAPITGQSWEIDEPGWVFGDIYDHVLDGQLDNSNALPEGMEDDVSMAMGWNFSLLDGESALLSLTLSESVPVGFYLAQHDSAGTHYLSGSLDISTAPAPVPEPGTLILLGTGLAGLCIASRKRLPFKR
jgi:hypothetical protein